MTTGKSYFWIGLLAVNLSLILVGWWSGSGNLLAKGGASAAIALGRLMGLLTTGGVLLQFTLMGRSPWLEGAFGLDKLARLHHVNGQLTGLWLVLHPVLLIGGYGQLAGINWWEQLKIFLFDYEHVWLAGVAFILLVTVVGTSIAIVRRRWRYETWYFIHLLVYLAVLAAVWHQFSVGTDLLINQFFYTYWLGLYLVVIGSHVIWRFGRPIYRWEIHQFAVSRVERENHNTVSIYISGRNLADFKVQPGQFMILRFLTRGLWWQAHPFSLSRLPDGKYLRITVKELGDFTKQVSQIPPGTKVIIDGPYGLFTEWVSVSPKVLFIAGGIGITPVRSLMEQMLRKGKDAILLYANKTKRDIVFDEELDRLEQRYRGKVIDVISDDPTFTGEKGYIDAQKLGRLVPDLTKRDIYVCGPPPMMTAVISILRQLGVPNSRIHWEKFAL